MLNQDLFYFLIYTLFVALGFKLIFLSSKNQSIKPQKTLSPRRASSKSYKAVQKINHSINITEIQQQQKIQQQYQSEKQTTQKFNLVSIQQSPSPQDQDTKTLMLVQQAIAEESEIQKLNSDHSQKILVSETHSLNKKQKQKIRKEREINRLKAVKDHYKTIIAELQLKLQNHCRQHNESLQSLNPCESIIFQESDTYLSYDQNSGPFQLNVSEIKNLKEQLYMHQQILTNLLEQQNELKDKVRELESENKKLIHAQSIHKQNQQPKDQSQIFINILSNLINSQRKDQQNLLKNTELLGQSRTEIYESHIIETERNMQRSNLQLQSPQNYMTKSTISMMSILEGVLNVGLLGQCRFLNEINKKYVLQQIKKAVKKKVIDAQIAYNSQQVQKGDILRELKEQPSILFLMKLSNSKKLALFLSQPLPQEAQSDTNFIVLIDLNKRKSITATESINCQEKTLIFGNEEIIITRSMPLTLSSKGTGAIITESNPIEELINHSENTITISILEIYTLIFQD